MKKLKLRRKTRDKRDPKKAEKSVKRIMTELNSGTNMSFYNSPKQKKADM